jgi:hypothetical protein
MVLKNKIVFALLGFLLAAVVTLGIGNAVSASGIERPVTPQATSTTQHANGTFHFERNAVYYDGYLFGWNVYLWTPSGSVSYVYFVYA